MKVRDLTGAYPTAEERSAIEADHPGWKHNAGNVFFHESGAMLNTWHGVLKHKGEMMRLNPKYAMDKASTLEGVYFFLANQLIALSKGEEE